jgi:uncharacterized protein
LIAIDTNILVYAHRRDSSFFARASEVIRSLALGRAGWAIPWPCLHEFLAVVTNLRAFSPPSTLVEATRQVDYWLESPTLSVLGEADEHWDRLKPMIHKGRISGGGIHDARVAAICLSHGVSELWSADRDFSRFPELKIRNPLVG